MLGKFVTWVAHALGCQWLDGLHVHWDAGNSVAGRIGSGRGSSTPKRLLTSRPEQVWESLALVIEDLCVF